MLDRVGAVCGSFEGYLFINPHAEARFRSHDGKYLPGRAVFVSESPIAGTALPLFKQKVEDDLSVAGGWESNPEKVERSTIEGVRTWRVVEALERENGTFKMMARGNDSIAAEESKKRTVKEDSKDTKEVTCWLCGGRGHRRKVVSPPEAQGR